MPAPGSSKLVRIALFIDGGYFDEVSRYYKFGHSRGTRISVEGLQKFVTHSVAEHEGVDEALCQIVEAHYFRGRFTAADADAAGKLRDQASFDDILIRSGIRQHYLHVVTSGGGPPRERGIEVSLSLEAFDMATSRGFEVLALVACDGDYAHLLKKLNGVGVRCMVLAWDFQYDFEDYHGRRRHKETRTAQALIDHSSYPVIMAPLIDEHRAGDDELFDDLFVG